MKILIDMNLAPEWEPVLQRDGHEAAHWSTLGDPRATDETIMQYAQDHHYMIFTHDLDFGAILAATRATGPSVLQIRTQDTFPEYLEKIVISTLKQYEPQLIAGALISVDERAQRVRILPIR